VAAREITMKTRGQRSARTLRRATRSTRASVWAWRVSVAFIVIVLAASVAGYFANARIETWEKMYLERHFPE
jgi:hypothetical protein